MPFHSNDSISSALKNILWVSMGNIPRVHDVLVGNARQGTHSMMSIVWREGTHSPARRRFYIRFEATNELHRQIVDAVFGVGIG